MAQAPKPTKAATHSPAHSNKELNQDMAPTYIPMAQSTRATSKMAIWMGSAEWSGSMETGMRAGSKIVLLMGLAPTTLKLITALMRERICRAKGMEKAK